MYSRRTASHREIRQVSRAEMMGGLTASLAHELNQPLALLCVYHTLRKAIESNRCCFLMPAQTNNICIVDDDSSMRRSIQQLLDSDGLMAVTFENAEDFLAHVCRYSVSLAVLDVWMPGTNSLEVQARLNEVSPDTKVIVMTARETPAIRTAALQAGAFAFVLKPFDDEAFLSLVHQALRGVTGT